MKRKVLVVSILLHALLIMSVYAFQGVIFPYMRLGGLAPLLLPIASTGVALYEGKNAGGITGLFAGILCDISFNQPAGVFTVFLTISGLLVGTLADTVILRGFVTYYISCAVVLILSAFVQIFPLIILSPNEIPLHILVPIALQQTMYSLILALPMWFFIRALGMWSERVSPSGRTY